MKILRSLLFMLVCLFSTTSYAGLPFLVLTDVHFNPFVACYGKTTPCHLIEQLEKSPYQKWHAIFASHQKEEALTQKKDTDYTLLQSTLTSIKKRRPQFVLLLGDFLAHENYKQYKAYSNDPTREHYARFIYKTMAYLNAEFKTAIPKSIPIYAITGNEDTYSGLDYYVKVNGDFYQSLATLWSKNFILPSNKKAFEKSFPHAGYYAATLPEQPALKIIALNTVLFSIKAHGKNIPAAAKKELHWLALQLASAKKNHQAVIIISHIPPGINVYSGKRFWRNTDNTKFLNLLARYHTIIRGLITGHTHMDGFTRISPALIDSFVPAISPIFGNNPGYKMYQLNTQNLQLTTFDTYYLPLQAKKPVWQHEYNFNEIYQPDCKKPCTLASGAGQLTLSSKLTQDYQKYYSVSVTPPIINHQKWRAYWCGIKHLKLSTYERCHHIYTHKGAAPKLRQYIPY